MLQQKTVAISEHKSRLARLSCGLYYIDKKES